MVHSMRETENTKDESNGLLFNNLLLFPKIFVFCFKGMFSSL